MTCLSASERFCESTCICIATGVVAAGCGLFLLGWTEPIDEGQWYRHARDFLSIGAGIAALCVDIVYVSYWLQLNPYR